MMARLLACLLLVVLLPTVAGALVGPEDPWAWPVQSVGYDSLGPYETSWDPVLEPSPWNSVDIWTPEPTIYFDLDAVNERLAELEDRVDFLEDLLRPGVISYAVGDDPGPKVWGVEGRLDSLIAALRERDLGYTSVTADTAPVSGGDAACSHCWHGDGIVLTSLPPQYPQTCCKCGAHRTVMGRNEWDLGPGHGPYGPRRPWTITPVDDVPMPDSGGVRWMDAVPLDSIPMVTIPGVDTMRVKKATIRIKKAMRISCAF